jgi:hypothetical protein
VHTVRTHKAADDRCFGCVRQREDAEGKLGVSLSKKLMAVAGDALKTNITTLGPSWRARRREGAADTEGRGLAKGDMASSRPGGEHAQPEWTMESGATSGPQHRRGGRRNEQAVVVE